MNKIKITIVFLMAVIFAVACNQPTARPNVSNSPTNTSNLPGTVPTASPSPVDEATLARNLYTTNCMICHKDSGKGGKTTVDGKAIDPDDLTSDKMKAKSDEKLSSYIADGIEDEGMPAFKGKLSDAEIKAVVKHMRVLQK